MLVTFGTIEITHRLTTGVKNQHDADRSPSKAPARFLNAGRDLAGGPSETLKGVTIAFLGDSWTYGSGVTPDETFVRKADVWLNARSRGQFKTINLGAPGADTIQEWAIYNRARDQIRPRVLVQVLTPNDMDVDLYLNANPVLDSFFARTSLLAHFKSLQRVEATIRGIKAAQAITDYFRGGATPASRERSWRIISDGIASTKSLVEEAGGVHVLVRCPRLTSLKDYPLREVHQRTGEIAARLGIPYLDLLEPFLSRQDTKWVLPDDEHPNAAGHALIGEHIAEFLWRSVLPAIPPVPSTAASQPRPPHVTLTAEMRWFRHVLVLDPTCRSALLGLENCLRQQGIIPQPGIHPPNNPTSPSR